MKYKVGDKVRIRADLQAGMQYRNWIVTKSMALYAGCICEIAWAGWGYYELVGYPWGWTDEMLEPDDTDPAWMFDRPDAKKD